MNSGHLKSSSGKRINRVENVMSKMKMRHAECGAPIFNCPKIDHHTSTSIWWFTVFITIVFFVLSYTCYALLLNDDSGVYENLSGDALKPPKRVFTGINLLMIPISAFLTYQEAYLYKFLSNTVVYVFYLVSRLLSSYALAYSFVNGNETATILILIYSFILDLIGLWLSYMTHRFNFLIRVLELAIHITLFVWLVVIDNWTLSLF